MWLLNIFNVYLTKVVVKYVKCFAINIQLMWWFKMWLVKYFKCLCIFNLMWWLDISNIFCIFNLLWWFKISLVKYLNVCECIFNGCGS